MCQPLSKKEFFHNFFSIFELAGIRKHLMTGPTETVSFVHPQPQCSPLQLRVFGQQSSLILLGPVIKYIIVTLAG